MQINIHITQAAFDSMTWDDMIIIQNTKEGQVNYGALRELILPFIVDENKNPLPAEDARALLGKLNIGQIATVIDEVTGKARDFLSQQQSGNSAISG